MYRLRSSGRFKALREGLGRHNLYVRGPSATPRPTRSHNVRVRTPLGQVARLSASATLVVSTIARVVVLAAGLAVGLLATVSSRVTRAQAQGTLGQTKTGRLPMAKLAALATLGRLAPLGNVALIATSLADGIAKAVVRGVTETTAGATRLGFADAIRVPHGATLTAKDLGAGINDVSELVTE